MKKRLIRLILILGILTVVFTASCAYADETAKVKGGWLILRDAPGYDGRVLASYPTGTVVTILKKSGSWYRVKTPDRLQGYMLGKYLSFDASGRIKDGCTAYVTANNKYNVNLRSGAGTGYRAIASYAKGTKVKVVHSGSTWCYIRIGAVEGFMMTRYLTTKEPAPAPSTKAYVTSSNGLGVALRKGPGKNYSVLKNYPVGTEVKILSKGSTWSQIKIGSVTGYMMTRYLTGKKPAAQIPSGSWYVTSDNGKNVRLRTGPDTSYPVITTYAPGTVVKMLDEVSGWYYISIGSKKGYMMVEYVAYKD